MTSSNTPTLTGPFVQEMITVFTAAVLTAENCIVVSNPGTGKTTTARLFAEAVYGTGRWSFVRFSPVTPPSALIGIEDTAELINNNRVVLRNEGLPYDPAIRMNILDEAQRGGEFIGHMLIDLLNRVDLQWPHWQSNLILANYISASEAMEAMRDRISLWFWFEEFVEDMGAAMQAAAERRRNGRNATLTARIPTEAEIDWVRTQVPGQNAVRAISEFTSLVKEMITEKGYKLNKRRTEQWFNVLWSHGCWLTQDADFTHLPDETKRLIKYLMPAVTASDFNNWVAAIQGLQDIIATEIEAALMEAQQAFIQMAQASGDKMDRMIKLGKVQADCITNLKELASRTGIDQNADPRINKAIQVMNQLFAAAVNGDDPTSISLDLS